MASAAAIRAASAFVEVKIKDNLFNKQLKTMEGRLIKFGNRMRALGTKLFGAGAATLIPFGLSLKTFANFDNLIQELKALQGGAAGLDHLITQIEDLGRSTSFTATQIADAAINLSRLGFSVPEIEDTLASVLSLARATRTDLPRATQIAGDLMRSFGVDTKEATKFIDELVKTTNNSSQTLEQMFESLKTIGPQSKALNLARTNILAINAALADSGVKGTLAGTAIRRMLVNLTDLDRIKDLKKTLRVDVADKDGNLRDPVTLIKEIDDSLSTAGIDSVTRAGFFAELFEVRGQVPALVISDAIDKIKEFEVVLRNTRGEAKRTAEIIDTGLGNQFLILISAVQGAAIEIGKALKPAVIGLLQRIVPMLEAIANWITSNQKLMPQLAMIALSVSATGVAFLSLAVASFVAASGFGAIASAVTLLTSPFRLIIAVAGKVLSSLLHIGEKLMTVLNIKVGSGSAIVQLVSATFKNGFKALAAMVVLLKTAFMGLMKVVPPILAVLKHLIVNVGVSLKVIGDALKRLPALFKGLKAVASGALKGIKTLLTGLKVGLMGVGKGVMALISGIIRAIPSLIAFELVFATIGGVIGTFATILENLIKSFDGFGAFFAVLGPQIAEAFKDGDIVGVIDGIVVLVQSLFLRFKKAVVLTAVDIKNAVMDWIAPFQNMWENLRAIFKVMLTGFQVAFQGLFNIGDESFKNLSGTITHFIRNIVKNLRIGAAGLEAFGNTLRQVTLDRQIDLKFGLQTIKQEESRGIAIRIAQGGPEQKKHLDQLGALEDLRNSQNDGSLNPAKLLSSVQSNFDMTATMDSLEKSVNDAGGVTNFLSNIHDSIDKAFDKHINAVAQSIEGAPRRVIEKNLGKKQLNRSNDGLFDKLQKDLAAMDARQNAAMEDRAKKRGDILDGLDADINALEGPVLNPPKKKPLDKAAQAKAVDGIRGMFESMFLVASVAVEDNFPAIHSDADLKRLQKKGPSELDFDLNFDSKGNLKAERDKQGRKKFHPDSLFFRGADGKALVKGLPNIPKGVGRLQKKKKTTEQFLSGVASAGGFNFGDISASARGDRAVEVQKEALEVAKKNLLENMKANRQSATLLKQLGATP